jgi:hypothetical protein
VWLERCIARKESNDEPIRVLLQMSGHVHRGEASRKSVSVYVPGVPEEIRGQTSCVSSQNKREVITDEEDDDQAEEEGHADKEHRQADARRRDAKGVLISSSRQ